MALGVEGVRAEVREMNGTRLSAQSNTEGVDGGTLVSGSWSIYQEHRFDKRHQGNSRDGAEEVRRMGMASVQGAGYENLFSTCESVGF